MSLWFPRDLVAPLLTRPKDAWSNFWGALNDQGYYARSHNYLDIVNENIRWVWIWLGSYSEGLGNIWKIIQFLIYTIVDLWCLGTSTHQNVFSYFNLKKWNHNSVILHEFIIAESMISALQDNFFSLVPSLMIESISIIWYSKFPRWDLFKRSIAIENPDVDFEINSSTVVINPHGPDIIP